MSDLVPDDRALLDRARGGLEPSSEDRARVRGALAAQLGIGVALAAKTAAGAASAAGATAGGAATTTAGAATLGSSGLALKVLASVVLIGAIGASAAMYGTKTGSLPAAPKASAALMATAPAALVAPAAPASVPAEATASAEDLVAPSAAQAAPGSSTPASTAAPTRGRTTPTTKTEPSKVDPSGEGALTIETRLIGDANAALRGGDATRALSLLDEHARRFPGGVLAEERDAERVLALCAAGRTVDARTRTERFLRERPSSALAPKVRGSCGGQ